MIVCRPRWRRRRSSTSLPVTGTSSESLPSTSTAAAADRIPPPLSLSREVIIIIIYYNILYNIFPAPRDAIIRFLISLILLISFFTLLLKTKRPSTLTVRNVRLSNLLISVCYISGQLDGLMPLLAAWHNCTVVLLIDYVCLLWLNKVPLSFSLLLWSSRST